VLTIEVDDVDAVAIFLPTYTTVFSVSYRASEP